MGEPAEGTAAWKAQDKGPEILIISWIVTGLSTIFVAARFLVRAKLRGKVMGDDWFVLAALMCGYVSTGLSTAAVINGTGRHFATLTTKQQENAIMYTTAAFCPGIFSFALPKLAVVFLLTRLLNPSRFHKAFLWTIAILCQVILFVTVGVLLGRCQPSRSMWDFSVKGECFDVWILIGYGIFSGAYSAFVDLYLAIYPTVVLFKLQLSFKKKIALCCALGIGSISGIVAIYKSTRIVSLASADFSYDTADLMVWTVIEGSTIIIGCTIPLLQPLLEMILKRNPFSSSRDNSKTPHYYENYTDPKSDIELSRRKPKSNKLKDDLGLTVIEDDSQENILGNTTAIRNHTPVNPQAIEGAITRTDAVTVKYEASQNPAPTRGSAAMRDNWRPV